MSEFVTRRNPFTGKTNTRLLPITVEEIMRWESGELIQNVWPHLSADDREYIKTGITDWDDHFQPTRPQEPKGKTEDIAIVDDYDFMEFPKQSEFVKNLEIDLSENALDTLIITTNPEAVPAKEWSPPSKKVYPTTGFRYLKLWTLFTTRTSFGERWEIALWIVNILS